MTSTERADGEGKRLCLHHRPPLWLLRGGSQQIDDIGLVFERTRIGAYEAMIDRDLADLLELVFTDADVGESSG